MKILHTSDWHLGHRLHEQSQAEEHYMFLNWLKQFIIENEIDVLLVAGDIFDTGAPSASSQKMYYDFLIDLRASSCKHIIITGGNHDAPGTINAPKSLLEALAVHVVGRATDDPADSVFCIEKENEKVIVAAVPYLRDQDIRKAVSGESFSQIEERYRSALTKHYVQIADVCKAKQQQNEPIIAMGHLFAIGGQPSDSEQSIYVGNLGDISISDFPTVFNYIALGHLHRCQMVAKKQHVRYSGSPIPLSFSESGNDKKVLVLETSENEIRFVKEFDVPLFREIKSITGTLNSCIEQLKAMNTDQTILKPWVEVVLTNEHETGNANSAISDATKDLNLEVLKISIQENRSIKGLEKLIENNRHVKDLSPIEVFELKCTEAQYDLKDNPEIRDAFFEVLEMSKESSSEI